MAEGMHEIKQLRRNNAAGRSLNNWITGARALALLSGAADSGILSMLRESGTPAHIAATIGIDRQVVNDLCLALEAHGIVQRDGEAYRLTPDYLLLTSREAARPLASVLRQAKVMIGTLQDIAPSEATYTGMAGEDILAMAEAAGISAVSAARHLPMQVLASALPEARARWVAGAHHLEVGCGIGNTLLGLAISFPKVTAVGIEIDGLTAAEAERRAGLLGVTDRVQVRRMDACDLQDEAVFDTIQWSQYFFPTPTRAAVLRATRRALKPDGYLFMPWIGSISDDTLPSRRSVLRLALLALRFRSVVVLPCLTDLIGDTPARRQNERRLGALLKLMFGRWGVPVRTIGELSTELESEGFRVLRVIRLMATEFNFARGLLLAQRDAL